MSVLSVQTRKQRPRISIFEIAFMIFCCWYYIFPAASITMNFILMIGICGLYILYVIPMIPVRFVHEVGKMLLVSIIIAGSYYFLTQTVTIDTGASYYELKRYLSKFNQVFFAFFPLLLYARLSYSGTRKQKIIIVAVIFALIAYIVFRTWRELLVNSYVTRSAIFRGDAARNNIGTYSFTYAISVLIPAVMICYHYTDRITIKIISISSMVILMVFLISSQYTIALIVALFGLIVFILISGRDPIPKAVLIGVTFLVIMSLASILNYIVDHMETSEVTVRIAEISSALSGEGLGYNLNGRLTLYWDSLKAFFRSPIWGNQYLGFDGHATLLTVLSDVGLIGSIPYYYAYFSSNGRVFRLLGDRNAHKKFIPVFSSFIFMGFLNPIHSSLPIYIVVWLLAPLLIELFDPFYYVKADRGED